MTRPVDAPRVPRYHPDDRPSLRILLAARQLRHGEDPTKVSERTGVPLPLVYFLLDDGETTGA